MNVFYMSKGMFISRLTTFSQALVLAVPTFSIFIYASRHFRLAYNSVNLVALGTLTCGSVCNVSTMVRASLFKALGLWRTCGRVIEFKKKVLKNGWLSIFFRGFKLKSIIIPKKISGG